MASSSVDLPVPFSPMKNVTLGCSLSVSVDFTAGMLATYADSSGKRL